MDWRDNLSEKIFRDTRTQIGILKSRGLTIKNKKFAKQIIRRVNYYNLINGYKDPFLQLGTPYEKYISRSSINEIYALYEFDRKLRIITLEYILKIEKEVKSLISYSFSRSYGHKNYLKLENFDSAGTKKYDCVCSLLSHLYKTISRNINNDPSITHYVSGKNYVPLWVLMNSLSFGETSKFYTNMHQKERDDVAKHFKWGVRENELGNCLAFLTTIRNHCAHDERLYSYLSTTNLSNNKYFKYFRTAATNNYFAVMVTFKLLLSDIEYKEYHKKIEVIINELSSQLKSIPLKKIRGIMGLPANWRKLQNL